MHLDITARDYKTLKYLLNAYLPDITVWAFGSRVKFTSKPESDLDLVAFIQPAQESSLAELKDAFAESDLPFRVDILDWEAIPDNFKQNIKKDYVVLQDANTEIGMIPKNWRIQKLGDTVTFQRGHDLTISNFTLGPYPVAGSNGIIGYHKEYTTVGPNLTVGRSGNSIGVVHFYENNFWAHNTTLYVKEFKNCYPKFIYYLIKTLNFTGHNSGSAVPSLNRNYIYPIEVLIPNNYTEQFSIASILSTLDEKIELNQQIRQTLETTAQAIFKEWFVNFSFPGFYGELINGLPKGWKIGSIYELMDVIYGFPFKSDLFNENEQGIGLIRIRNLKNNKAGFYTTEQADDKYLVEPGDILAGMDAEFIPSIWLGEVAWLNQRVCKFSPNKEYVNELFILHSIKPLLERIQYGKVGTTVIHLGKADIDNFQITIPDTKLLQTLNKIFAPIHQKLIVIEKEIRLLKELRDYLLPKLMTGKIEVKK